MTALAAGENDAAVQAVAGHGAAGACASCGGHHSWDEVFAAAIAALDRKIAELRGEDVTVQAKTTAPADPVVPDTLVPQAETTAAGGVSYTFVPPEQNTPGEPETV